MLQKGEEFETDIIDMSLEGDGIARINGMVTFIGGAILGERVRVKIVKVATDIAFARLLKIIEVSSKRKEPECDAYNKRCGGCDLQHVNYASQLDYKEKILNTTLNKALHHNVNINKIIGMGVPCHYRNKLQYPVFEDRIGFFADRTHEIIVNNGCYIQNETIDNLAKDAFKIARAHGISTYNEVNKKGLIRHMCARIGIHTGEFMVIFVTATSDFPNKDEVVNEIVAKYPNITSIIQNINNIEGNVVYGEENITLYGRDFIYDTLGDYKFKISPLSFYQTNPVQTEAMYNVVKKYANLTGKENVFDLYCGIGTISIFLADEAKKVYGVEVVGEAVQDAKENAEINGIKNIEFIQGEAEKVVPKMYEAGNVADVVVVDPPRKGCEEELLNTIVNMKASKVIYVSCNQSTLGRDLKYLEDNGYEIKEIQPLDMFPQTKHVETVCLLTLKV